MSKKRLTLLAILAALLFGLGWFLFTSNDNIWPVRNALQYHILSWWWKNVREPAVGAPGQLRGTVQDASGQPIAGAWVLLSRPDGTTHQTRSDEQGHYVVSEVPADTYRPVAGAVGYESVQFGHTWNRVQIKGGAETVADVVLPTAILTSVPPGTDFSLGEATKLTCNSPLESEAIRQQIHFQSDGQDNQLSFYYTPTPPTATDRWPILLTIYPGPADTWECVSLPLADAGYAVIATGPAYSFNLERDLDELEQLLAFAQAGDLPGADASQVALIGGSYSSLHVQRLLQRKVSAQAALLMGPPTDLFDMRRRLENGTFVPPFGLDQAFYALGLPSREPLRYWQYSGAYHVSPDFPPLAIIHSKTDDVVPYQQSELLATQLEAAGVPHEVHIFEGGGHYLLAPGGDSEMMYDIALTFFEEHLK